MSILKIFKEKGVSEQKMMKSAHTPNKKWTFFLINVTNIDPTTICTLFRSTSPQIFYIKLLYSSTSIGNTITMGRVWSNVNKTKKTTLNTDLSLTL